MLRTTLTAIALSTAVAGAAFADGHEAKTIVETAQEAGSFTTLLAAAEAAGLVDALNGDGPLTVFAPTDEAFTALPAGTVEGLLEDTDTLKGILLYHVVDGMVMSTDLSDGMKAETLNGGATVTIDLDDGAKVNGANIVTADIKASNGVIHVIDTVLIPTEEAVK